VGMRLWHQSMASLSEFGAYVDVLRRHVDAVIPPDLVVDLHGSYPGSYLDRAPADILPYPVVKHFVQEQIFDHCLRAEREGYDAIALASFSEPFLTEVRSLVDIPVASMPETCMLVGCSYASRLALVTLTPRSIPRVRALVEQHRLGGRVIQIVALDPPVTESYLVAILNGQLDPAALLSSFRACVSAAASAGADLIIPAEGALNEVLWSQELFEVNGLTIMDGLSVVLRYAQLMVDLKRTVGLGPARAASYPLAPPELVARAMDNARSHRATTGEGDAPR
jgi:allantoin racemase